MGKFDIAKIAGTYFNKVGLKLQKYSPEIFIAIGIAGTIISTVKACKATTKISDIIDESKETIDTIHGTKENKEMAEVYTEKDAKKDLTIVYVQTGIKLAKAYIPSILIGAASLSCIIYSHHILNKRNMALAAAYATVDKGFKTYRSRVVERFGKQVDQELRYNIKARTINNTEKNEITGEETDVSKTIKVVDKDSINDYTCIFDKNCDGWEKNYDYNVACLRVSQNYANDLLKARGHLFLNEILDRLGLPRTKEGQIVGWVYNKNSEAGDNYVDFRIMEIEPESGNINDTTFVLDFNVDGDIWSLMK